jgi:pimeloyl-ACP methyl ester carboxylesterase
LPRLGVDDAVDVVRLTAAYAGEGPVVVGGWSYGAYLAGRGIVLGAQAAGLVSLSGFLSPEIVRSPADPSVAAFLRAHRLPPTASEDLADLPVLAIHGRHDGRVPLKGHREYVSDLRRGSLVELPDDGHGIVTDPGAAVAYPALASWLASL